MPDVISVRQTRSLPPASFRFLVAKDTLALSYALGTINPCSGLSPVRLRPCWAHTYKAVGCIRAISTAFKGTNKTRGWLRSAGTRKTFRIVTGKFSISFVFYKHIVSFLKTKKPENLGAITHFNSPAINVFLQLFYFIIPFVIK
jgi:hypothetical protein